jgi:sugar phosphate isomerase/epimerase
MKKNQVAIQLYTLRDHLQTVSQAAETLKKVRAIGYATVEVAGLGKVHDDELTGMLDGEGLSACAVHESGDLILNEPGRCADRAKKLGCTYVVYAWPAGVDFGNPDAVRKLIDGLQASGEAMSGQGITLCYHNHQLEFRRFGSRTVLEEIFGRTREQHVQAELDTHWVQVGGGNPAEWCRRMTGRLPLLHMKDYAIDDSNRPVFAEIGSGNLEWPRIIAAADAAGCKWFVVEQDVCPGDPFTAIKTSYEFTTTRLCSG